MIGKALQNLRPGSKWTVRGNSYDGIDWKDTEQTKPTEEEVNSEIARLQSEEPMKRLRDYRNSLLAASDWMANSDVTMSDAWRTYRQTLRDLPANTTDPANPVWPTEPS